MRETFDPVFDVTGKVIVLTGACGTIGRTLAEALASRHARLVLVDRDNTALDALKSACGGNAIVIEADVALESEVARILTTTLSSFGRVDVLINSHQCKPPSGWGTPAEEFALETWQQIVDVNLTGTFLMCRDLGRQMLGQGKGSIINLASTYAVVSSNPSLYTHTTYSNAVAYSASKGGVVMLTKYLGAYWAKRGVRVNCVSPHGVLGRVDEVFVDQFSAMSPMGRTMAPREIVGAILFLASDASSYTTGSNLLVEGGWTAW